MNAAPDTNGNDNINKNGIIQLVKPEFLWLTNNTGGAWWCPWWNNGPAAKSKRFVSVELKKIEEKKKFYIYRW